MANLGIKTPSSASLVLIFQLLVLRPRPNDHPRPNHISCAIGGGALPDICIVLSPPLVVRTHSYRNFTNIIFVTIILRRSL